MAYEDMVSTPTKRPGRNEITRLCLEHQAAFKWGRSHYMILIQGT